MSTILIVDQDPKAIVHVLERFTGVNFFTATNINDGIDLLSKQQFDYILCEQDLSLLHDTASKSLFRETCIKSQPATEFYYLIPNDKIEKSKAVKEEMFNADGVIRKPLEHNIIQLIVGTDLVDQTGIDELFNQLKKSD